MKSKRLAFAHKYASWSPEQWIDVLFSDESTVRQFATRQRNVCWLEGKLYNDRYLPAIVKRPPSLMVWGAMSAKGTAGFYFLPHSMTVDGSRYLNVLKEKLELYMNVHQCDTFMHDDAPCHRSKLVSSFLQENQVKVLDCSGNSLDLNPIENFWKLMKDRVVDKHSACLKVSKMPLKIVWTKEISSDFCKRITDSIPRRLQAVIENHAGHTKY